MCKRGFIRRLGLTILVGTLCISNVRGAYPDTLSQGEIIALIDTCIARSKKIETIQCKLIHEQTTSMTPLQRFEGSIRYLRPDHVRIHFFAPAEEFFMATDSAYTFYSVDKKRGMRFTSDSLNPIERRIMHQLGHIKMNELQTMRDVYEFSFAGFVGDTAAVVSATPKNGWQNLSKILLKLDTEKKYLVGIELYDTDGVLVSQKVFYDAIRVPETATFFPTRILSKSVSEKVMKTDKIHYTRVRFNTGMTTQAFTIPVDSAAVIVEPDYSAGDTTAVSKD